jgi:integrase
MGLYRRKTKTGKVRKHWWVSYMDGGRQRHESAHTSNKREAERWLAVRRAQVAEGRLQLPASRPPFFKEFAKEFLGSIPHQNTRRTYQSCINNLNKSFAPLRLSEITVAAIEKFKEHRLSKGTRRATVNRDLSVLRRMLRIAERRRLIAFTPMRSVEFYDERKERRQPHIITFQEQSRILTVAPPHLRALIVLLTETGLRVDREGLRLCWEDIDLEASTLYVRDSKTPSGRRVVPLSEFCKSELESWKALSEGFHSPFVFPNSRKPSVPLKSVRASWKTTLKLAGLSDFPIYNCRHTCATRLAGAGIPDVIIRQLIGHTADSVTLLTYAKAVDEVRRGAIASLEKYRNDNSRERGKVQ